MLKSPPARSARTTPLHKSRLQMTKKKDSTRKTLRSTLFLWTLPKCSSERNVFALGEISSRSIERIRSKCADKAHRQKQQAVMFASFGLDGAKHLASNSCEPCLRRPGVVWLSLTQFPLDSRSPMGTQQCLRSDIF